MVLLLALPLLTALLQYLGPCRKRRCGECGRGNLEGGGKADQERGGDRRISRAEVHLERHRDLSSELCRIIGSTNA